MVTDFRRVKPTAEEVDRWCARNRGRKPSVYRVQCNRCGTRIWGAGIAIAAHRRACKGTRPAECICDWNDDTEKIVSFHAKCIHHA